MCLINTLLDALYAAKFCIRATRSQPSTGRNSSSSGRSRSLHVNSNVYQTLILGEFKTKIRQTTLAQLCQLTVRLHEYFPRA